MEYIISFFGLELRQGKDEYPIPCPFHEDKSPSASINLKKKVFNCLKSGCVGGLSLKQLEKKLKNLSEGEEEEEKEETTEIKDEEYTTDGKNIFYQGIEINEWILNYFKSRGISKIPEHSFNDGYIRIYLSQERWVERGINTHPKYRNPPGNSQWVILNHDKNTSYYIFVEGVFDGLTLIEAGLSNIVVMFGSKLAQKYVDSLFYFKGSTCYICFDTDPSGYRGAKKLQQTLQEFDINSEIVNIPKPFNDINDFWVSCPANCKAWANKIVVDKISSVEYVKKYFTEEESLSQLKTGIDSLDKIIQLKTGCHIIAGKTATGKTSLLLWLCLQNLDKKILFNNTELPQRQIWARIASMIQTQTAYSWELLEQFPDRLGKKDKERLLRIAEQLDVKMDLSLDECCANDADIICIDYIQRMKQVKDNTKESVDTIISTLSKLAARENKLVLIVSSLNRESYTDPDSFGLKWSGDLEYCVSSVSRLSAIGPSQVVWRVQKNTRGLLGSTTLNVDFAKGVWE